MITAILGMLSPKVSNTAGPGPGNLRLALRTGDRCGSVAWDQSGNEAKARGKSASAWTASLALLATMRNDQVAPNAVSCTSDPQTGGVGGHESCRHWSIR